LPEPFLPGLEQYILLGCSLWSASLVLAVTGTCAWQIFLVFSYCHICLSTLIYILKFFHEKVLAGKLKVPKLLLVKFSL
jgi:hypothetical protein